MSDEAPLLIKLSHPAAPGKSRDSKEVPIRRENRRGKQARKPPLNLESPEDGKENEIPDEVREAQRSGKVLDITI